MKEEIIIKVLNRASEFIDLETCRKLQLIMQEEMQHYTVEPECTALAVRHNLPSKIGLYLASKKIDGMSPKTIKNYWLILNRFSTIICKDIDQITDIDIRMYLAQYLQTGIMDSTLSTVVTTLKSFFSWLVGQDYLQKTPMWNIKSTKVKKRVRKALSDEELELLRCTCKTEREKAIVEFFYSTGCRLDEVHKLNRNDIDWINKSCRVIGKGNKEREVYLSARAVLFLQKYLQTRSDMQPSLFIARKLPHNRLSGRSFEDIVKDLGKRAGIQKNLHPHILRHTFANALLNNGASLAEVQRLLGHEDSATTLIYAQLNNEDIQISHKKHLA
jgi:integrase/recombinase XerD